MAKKEFIGGKPPNVPKTPSTGRSDSKSFEQRRKEAIERQEKRKKEDKKESRRDTSTRYKEARETERYKTDPEFRREVEKSFAFERAGITDPTIQKPTETRQEAIRRSATRTAERISGIESEVRGKPVSVSVEATEKSKEAIRAERLRRFQEQTKGLKAGDIIPRQRKEFQPEKILFPTYGIPSLERRNLAILGAVSKQEKISEQQLAQKATQLGTTPGNIIYNQDNKIIAAYSSKDRTLFYTEAFRPEKKPKTFTEQVIESPTAVLAVGVSKGIKKANILLGKPLKEEKFRFGQDPTFEEAKEFIESPKTNPFLLPVKKYEEFKARTGKNNIVADVFAGASKEVFGKPLKAAGLVGVGAIAGGVVGGGSKIIRGLPLVQKISGAVKSAPLIVRTAPRGIGIGANVLIGAGAMTSAGISISRSEKPAETLGRTLVEFGALGAGFKSGFTSGQRIIGKAQSKILDLRYKGRLSTDLPVIRKTGLPTRQTKSLSTDLRAEVREIKGISLGQVQNQRQGARFAFLRTGEKKIIPLKDIPRGDAVLLTGKINRGVTFRFATPKETSLTKKLILRKPSETFFTAKQTEPLKFLTSKQQFKKLTGELPVIRRIEGTGIKDLFTKQTAELTPKLITFPKETGLTTTKSRPVFKLLSQSKPLTETEVAKARFGFLDVKAPGITKPPSAIIQEIFAEKALLQGLKVKPKPVFKIIKFTDIVKPVKTTPSDIFTGASSGKGTIQILKTETVKEDKTVSGQVSRQKVSTSLSSQQKQKAKSETISEQLKKVSTKFYEPVTTKVKVKSKLDSVSKIKLKDRLKSFIGAKISQRQAQSQNQISKVKVEQSFSPSQKIKQVQSSKQISGQVTGASLAFAQISSQKLQLLQKIKSVTQPSTVSDFFRSKSPSKPKPPITPLELPETSSTLAGEKEIKGIPAFSVFLKLRGKEFKVASKQTRERALDIGVFRAKTSLGATFRIEKELGRLASKQRSLGLFKRFGSEFRTFRVKQGKKIPLQDTFIQRRKFRLGTKQERSLIQRARKNKRLL